MPLFRRIPALLTLLALGLPGLPLRAEGPAEDAPAPRTQWVQGSVQSLGSPDAVAGATVEDLSSHRLTVTAQDGSFRLEVDSAPDTPALRAYADGFAPLTRRWPRGLPRLLKLGLRPNVMNGGEITITGQRDHPEPSHPALKA